MKKLNLLPFAFAALICTIAIACHAQDDTYANEPSFEELLDHPWFVEYRAINQRISDMHTYKLVDNERLRKVFENGFDPCDAHARANLEYGAYVDNYMELMCRKGQLQTKIHTTYPHVRTLPREQRIELMSKIERLTPQEIEQLYEIRMSADPDRE